MWRDCTSSLKPEVHGSLEHARFSERTVVNQQAAESIGETGDRGMAAANDTGPIDCEEALHRLFEYVDTELSAESRREMEQHLERCRTCYSRLEFEKRMKTHIADLGGEAVPPAFEQRIRKALESFKC
jgi:mycothiol system anti-sigma-R factor